MTYSINKTDGTIIAVVADGTIDTTTSLQLPGKLFQNYGEPINENLIKLLENSASGTAPSAPLAGELWWDTTNSKLKVYSGSAFVEIATSNSININEITSADSSEVIVNDSLSITGSLSVNTIDTNTISSNDSTQVTIDDGFRIKGTVVMMANLPTSDPSNAGQLYNDSGALKVSAG